MQRPVYRQPLSMTAILVAANVLIYFLFAFLSVAAPATADRLLATLELNPNQLAHGAVWQLLSFQFLHGGVFHLLVNCLMLYIFGRQVEILIGPRAMLGLYLTSGAIGGLLHCLLSWTFPGHFGMHPVVGASAGVFGLLAVFAVLNKDTQLTALIAFIIPVQMRAKTLLLIMLGITVLGLLNPRSNIAHAAHLGGMLVGIVYARYLLHPERFQFRLPKIRIDRVYSPATKSSSAEKDIDDFDEDGLPPDEFMRREVDPILDKILTHGLESLSERERKILERARQKVRQK